jgi:hypothetical protein
MRPILQPRAACVIGHRAKDELTHIERLPSDESDGFDCPQPRLGARQAAVSAASTSRGKGRGFEQPPTVWGQALFAVRARRAGHPFGDDPALRRRPRQLALCHATGRLAPLRAARVPFDRSPIWGPKLPEDARDKLLNPRRTSPDPIRDLLVIQPATDQAKYLELTWR